MSEVASGKERTVFLQFVLVFQHLILDGTFMHMSIDQSTFTVFIARRNARIASAVLATTIPSVCSSVRPSVTRRYCVKMTARSTVQFTLSDSKMCLVF